MDYYKRVSFIYVSCMFMVLLMMIPSSATIINIPADYSTIQAGIDASSDGDTVLVTEGHYYERINFYGKGILLTSEFMWDSDTLNIQNTIIDADTLELGVVDTGSVVCFANGEASTSVIQGFTIQNGIGSTDYIVRFGGGIYCSNSDPIIRNNIICENYTSAHGSGIYCHYTSNALIINNTIRNNTSAQSGGGIYATGSTIESNIIIDNNASYGGGGIVCTRSIVTNNTISRNSALAAGGINQFESVISGNIISDNTAGFGAGIECYGGNIINNTIIDNYANGRGGGIGIIEGNVNIDNNTISGNTASYGGGIYITCMDEAADTIRNNLISGNTANYGGGICCHDYIFQFPGVLIDQNVISDNNSYYGGGGIMCDYYSNSVTINNNILLRNNTNGFGGGIACNESSPQILNNIINDNIFGGIGGGISCNSNSNAFIFGNIISENSGIDNGHNCGGGIGCRYSEPTIENNTISRNLAFTGGSGFYSVGNFSDPIIKNTILWADSSNEGNEIFIYSGSPIFTYCNIQGGWEGEGNIDIDPLFIDPDNGDFHLQAGSPCIDTGDPNSPLDSDSTRADIGAFYFDQTVGFDDIISQLPELFNLSQNYPNPFNARTTIQYTLPKTSDVAIDIYDILGRKVETLLNIKHQAGNHQVIWNASDKSSGMYFYKLQTDDYIETKKMLLLK